MMIKNRQCFSVSITCRRHLAFVWDFEPLYLGFVSYFDIRISNLLSLFDNYVGSRLLAEYRPSTGKYYY